MKKFDYKETLEMMNFKETIDIMKACFLDYTNGVISQEERSVQVLPDGSNQNIFALMPAYLGKKRYFGAKIITAFPENRKLNINTHLGEVMLFDSKTGIPRAMVNANAITWLRTAAVSALATDYLAKKNAEKLTLIGAGQQAISHLEAINCVRDIKKVYVYDLDERSRTIFINKMQERYSETVFVNCSTLDAAVQDTDIICTLTPAKTAFLDVQMVPKGVHINAIGTFTPDTREVKSSLISGSKVFVDDYHAAMTESGDILIPISEGNFNFENIVASLGEIVSEEVIFNRDTEDITIFDAVGLAVEDLCCAEYIYEKSILK